MQAFGASISEDQGVLNAYTKVSKLTAAADKGGSEDSISASERTTERTAERLEPTSHELMELEDIQSVEDQLMGAGVTQESDTATVFPFSLCGTADNKVKVHAKGTARNYSADDKESEARSAIPGQPSDSSNGATRDQANASRRHTAQEADNGNSESTAFDAALSNHIITAISILAKYTDPHVAHSLTASFQTSFQNLATTVGGTTYIATRILRLTSLKPYRMFRMSWNVSVRE